MPGGDHPMQSAQPLSAVCGAHAPVLLLMMVSLKSPAKPAEVGGDAMTHVNVVAIPEILMRKTILPCQRWPRHPWDQPAAHFVSPALAANRELGTPFPGADSAGRVIPGADFNHWVAEVQTSAFGGAGTSARAYMVLHGEQGSSAQIPLEGQNVMQRGSLDVFTLPPGMDQLGHLVKLTLGHDNKVGRRLVSMLCSLETRCIVN